MKKCLFLAALAAISFVGSRPAYADSVSVSFTNLSPCGVSCVTVGNLLTLTPVAGGTDFAFGTQQITEIFVNGVLMPGDSLTNTSFSLPAGFELTGYTGSGFGEVGTFSPAAGLPVTIGSGATGSFTGTLQFTSIGASNNSIGDFTIDTTLTNLTGTPGTSKAVTDFLAANGGTGSIQFNFSVGQNVTTVAQLLSLSGSTLAQGNEIGTLSSVPEPGSIALLGTGLFALGTIMRRRRTLFGVTI